MSEETNVPETPGMTSTGARGPRPVERTEARVETRRDRADARNDASVVTLLRDLADDVADLVRKEMALARSEVGSAVSGVKAGIGGVASGGGVLFAGFLFLLLSAMWGLAAVVDLWLAALIVGAVVSLIGYAMLKAGQKKLEAESFKPERTADSLRKDKEMLQRRTP